MHNKSSKRLLLMSPGIICLVAIIVLLMGSALAYSNTGVQIAKTAILQGIDSGRITSAAVAIMDNGEITYAEGFGMANQEKGIPSDLGTLFNIGSVSKVITATAVMILVDDGKIELDTPVTDYIADFVMKDPRYRNITVRMLLNHTSGLPGTTWANGLGYVYHEGINQDILEVLARSHLRHDPGEFAVYCNDGFSLAEMIVERVTGQKYIEFLSERVFEPLSLRDIGVSVGERRRKNVARYYSLDSEQQMPLEVVSFLGAGGLSSSVVDLVRFAEVFSQPGGILSESALQEMKIIQSPFSTELPRNARPSYGLGWDLTNLPRCHSHGIQMLGKSGDTANYSTMLITVPDQRLSLAVVQVGPDCDAENVALSLLDALLKEKGLISNEQIFGIESGEDEPFPESYGTYNGYYVGNGGMLYNIILDFTEDVIKILGFINGAEVPVISLNYGKGYLYDSDGNVSYFIDIDGASYYIANLPVGNTIHLQKLDRIDIPQTLEIDMDERVWVRRNVEAYEGLALTSTHLIQSHKIDALPGYIHFGGIKRVESSRFAGMPAEMIRDLKELTLIEKEGEIWVWDSDMLYSPAEYVKLIETSKARVTIDSTGYNEWLKVVDDAKLSFDMPVEGRIIVFSVDGSSLYDSVVDEGEVSVTKGCFIELIGKPGDVFTVRTDQDELPITDLKTILDEMVANNDVPGALLAIETPLGSWIGTAGIANLDTEMPVHPDMQVRIASITKPFTALTVMKLEESGVLSLDDTVERWLPGRVPGGKRITIRSLLNHTAGVASITNSTDFWNKILSDPLADWSASDVLERSAQFTPLFEPGTSFSYSNTGYYLLGMIIETVTERSVSEVMNELIFEPVGMVRSDLTRTGEMTPPFAHGYAWLPTTEEIVDCSEWNMSWDWTAGGAVTTGADMLLFTRALFDGEIVTLTTLEDMITPSELTQGFGLGLGIVEDTELINTTIIGHSGATPGTATLWYYFPEFEITIFVVVNRQDIMTEPDQVTPVDGSAVAFDIFIRAWQAVFLTCCLQ